MTVARKRDTPEHRLQCAVVQYLILAGVRDLFWYAIQNEGKRKFQTTAALKAAGMRPGAPDLCIIYNGIAHGLELKVKGRKQSEAQEAVEAEWMAAGGLYEVATGIEEAIAVLRRWGVIRARQDLRRAA